MIVHRFVDLFDEGVPEPDIVFLTTEAGANNYFSIWKAGNLATPERFDQTIISSLNGSQDFLGDPELSPDGTLVVYSRAGNNTTPDENSILVVDWEDTASTEIINESGGAIRSLQPTWSPDGTLILYRGKGSGTTVDSIKVCDPDGTNGSTLYTGSAQVENPQWSYDGTLIAWTENNALKVMNADGSSPTTIYSTKPVNAFPGWARTQSVIGFQAQDSSAFSANRYWYRIDADGTNLTLLHTIDRSSGYGPSDVDPFAIRWSWLLDDTAIITTLQVPADPDPDHVLTFIYTDGSGTAEVSPEQRSYFGTTDARPVAFANRIYWVGNNTWTEISSVALDGSDERVDFDGTDFTPNVAFHGFRGDTLTP